MSRVSITLTINSMYQLCKHLQIPACQANQATKDLISFTCVIEKEDYLFLGQQKVKIMQELWGNHLPSYLHKWDNKTHHGEDSSVPVNHKYKTGCDVALWSYVSKTIGIQG